MAFNSILSWTELNRRCVFRFVNGGVTEDRHLAVSTLRVKQPPHLPGGEATYVNIEGKRVSNLRDSKCFRDFDLSWDELGDDVEHFAYILSRCFETQLAGGQIIFCPTFPYVEERATPVLLSVADETLAIVYDKQSRTNPANLNFKSINSYSFTAPITTQPELPPPFSFLIDGGKAPDVDGRLVGGIGFVDMWVGEEVRSFMGVEYVLEVIYIGPAFIRRLYVKNVLLESGAVRMDAAEILLTEDPS